MKTFILKPFIYMLFAFSQIALAAQIPEVLRSNNILPNIEAESWVLLEPATGWVLAEKDADKRIEPASLTKLMTVYVLFDLLDQGRFDLLDEVTVSKKARYVEGSRMFLELNSKVSVLKLLKGIVVQSGNDASIAMAEHVSGTESKFVEKMNLAVNSLKLENTHFENVTGLPSGEHYSSARDIALISRAIMRDFPQFYTWFSIRSLRHNNISQSNRNGLLHKHDWVDGLKTGFTEAAGYCLAVSGKKADTRLIAVVTKTKSDKQRLISGKKLLDYGFANYEAFSVLPEKMLKVIPVSGGKLDSVEALPVESIHAVLPKGYRDEDKVSYEYKLEQTLIAPIKKGDNIGVVRIKYGNELIATSAVQVQESVELGSILKRLSDGFKRLF